VIVAGVVGLCSCTIRHARRRRLMVAVPPQPIYQPLPANNNPYNNINNGRPPAFQDPRQVQNPVYTSYANVASAPLLGPSAPPAYSSVAPKGGVTVYGLPPEYESIPN